MAVTTHPQRTRAPKPNQHDRAARQATIDVLLQRALRGALTIPEAAVLADYWRAEQRLAEKTRRSLGDTTRALERHRAAADTEIQRLEALVADLGGDPTPAHDSGPSIRECAADDRRWALEKHGE